jgi:NAD-dependent deacetylase
MKKITVLTGAGMSADSGLKTFRDDDGLWEGHDVMEVATPEAFERNPELVHDFYNKRRQQLKEAKPNAGHKALTKLEQKFNVSIVTQNVDDLHERAGSSNVIHLHGELLKVRSAIDPNLILEWREDLLLTDRNERGHKLRPHVVWFGEAVPMMEKAADEVSDCDLLIIIGTSMQVYPAAGLKDFAPHGTTVYFIDPNPAVEPSKNLKIIEKAAAEGVPELVGKLME